MKTESKTRSHFLISPMTFSLSWGSCSAGTRKPRIWEEIAKHKGFGNLDSKNEWFLLIYSIPSAKWIPGINQIAKKKVWKQRKPNTAFFGG